MSYRFTGRLGYSPSLGRMILTDRSDENDDRELHCGDCFELKVNGEWKEVRIEHSSGVQGGWYLKGLGRGVFNASMLYIGFEVRA